MKYVIFAWLGLMCMTIMACSSRMDDGTVHASGHLNTVQGQAIERVELSAGDYLELYTFGVVTCYHLLNHFSNHNGISCVRTQ